jgi:Fe-S oxidoreductase/nitrate reductase gamma subunit
MREVFVHAILQGRVLKRLFPGIMHFLIFWGMTIQVFGTVINILQYPLFVPVELPWPRGMAYLAFELVMDIGGGMIILGVLMAIFRRAVLRPKYLINRWGDWYALLLLLILTLLGFFSEGMRIHLADPTWRVWSPIGNLFALGFSALGVNHVTGETLHRLLFWSHSAAGLLFIASLPFTKLRHLITGPLHIFRRSERPIGALETIEDIETVEKLGVGQIDEFQSGDLLMFDACVQCGRCEEVCPSTISGMPYSPRDLMWSLHETMHSELISSGNGTKIQPLLGKAIDKESAWLCTTCGACLVECPLLIDPVSAAIELRRYLTLTTGEIPGPVGEALTQMERRGNPWGLPKEQHAPWAAELGIHVLQPGDETDILLYVGCALGYDSRSQKAASAFAKLLGNAGVDFAVLGSAEGCCGETARRLGHEYVFQVMVEKNIGVFGSVKFDRIVTPCAHCFNTLKNEYPLFGGEYTVVHHTEFLAELLREGKLEAQHKSENPTLTYHDSCYLGRYNQIYDDPRDVLDSIPGLKRSEMPRRMENGFCCGGGGGHMWMEIDPNTRINHHRLEEAVKDAQADVVVTGCPYCLIMFDDAIRSKGIRDNVEVKDLAEVLSASIVE